MKILNLLLIFTFFYGFGQNQNTDPVKDISEDACQCISQINTDNSTKNKAIKNCIASSIVKNLKTEVNNDKDHTTEIQIESKAYNQIESYLVENCAALKQLSFAENKKFKHATSNNVLAQLAYDDGIEYLEQNEFDNAIMKFKKAIEIDPNFAFAWDNLGVAFRKTNQYEAAIKAYKKSLAINPNGRLPLINIAVTYNLNKEYEKAISYYKKFIAVYQEDPEGYTDLD